MAKIDYELGTQALCVLLNKEVALAFLSSLSSDLREKADIDAEAGVQEYWVVDMPSSRIHVLSKGDGKSYRKIEIAVGPQLLIANMLTISQTGFDGSVFCDLRQ